MTDLGRREQFPPPEYPEYIEDIEVSRMAVFVAAVRILAERARLSSRVSQVPETASQLTETIRLKLFAGRSGSTADYDAPSSEIAAFRVSCRRIFWGLAAFSGLSNILMLTGYLLLVHASDPRVARPR